MSRVARYSDWCWIDRLDGVDLKHGELLDVHWPDGHAERITCVVHSRGVDIQDMGSKYTATESFAYAEAEHHGVKALVPLVGVEARRDKP
jgi:hypothetical protein